jgi:hypothetical protein
VNPSSVQFAPELMRRRKRDLAILICLSVLAYIIGNVMVHKDAGIPLSITLPIMTLTLTVLQYLLWRVTASYARTKAFKIFYAGLLIVQFAISILANQETSLTDSVGLSMLSHAMSLMTYCIIFYFIVRDMFANKHDATYSLLAASNAYFLIAIIFGTLYALIAVRSPHLLGSDVTTGLQLVQRTFQMSHFVVAGFDVPAYAGELLQNMAVVEAFIANLFIIF